jgi:hypothetical protein
MSTLILSAEPEASTLPDPEISKSALPAIVPLTETLARSTYISSYTFEFSFQV